MGRPIKSGEKKSSQTISVYPSELKKIIKRHKSLTKYVDDCIMRDGIRKPKTS